MSGARLAHFEGFFHLIFTAPILWLKMRKISVYFSGKRKLEVEERFSKRRKITAKIIWEPISSVRLNFLERILLVYNYAETQFMSIEIPGILSNLEL